MVVLVLVKSKLVEIFGGSMKLILTLLMLSFSNLLMAEDIAPDALVKEVTLDVLAIVKKDKDIQSGDRRKLLSLVEEKILPYFNFEKMTSLAMGRNWNKATPEQQKALTKEFKMLLVHTYSGALATYRDQTLDFRPYQGPPGEVDVVVKTLVHQPGREAISIDYRLEKTSSGWKVYDVTVAGISLVTNYRGTFAQQVRDSGIEGLIKSLNNKNRSLEGAHAKVESRNDS